MPHLAAAAGVLASRRLRRRERIRLGVEPLRVPAATAIGVVPRRIEPGNPG
jgi:hypothetical protein